MYKLGFFFLGFLFSYLVSAQVAYEDLERCFKTINEIQSSTDGKAFGKYKISFPKENFSISYSNKLATLAEYREFSGRDTLLLYENLDLSNVKNLYSYDHGTVGAVWVVFPQNSIQLKFIYDGKEIYSKDRAAVPFYFNLEKLSDKELLINNLAELIFQLKKEKNIISEDQINEEIKAWQKAVKENTFREYKKFYENYYSSIYNLESKLRMTDLDPAGTIKKLNGGEFYLGMKQSEFEKIIHDRLATIRSEKPMLMEFIKNYELPSDFNSEKDVGFYFAHCLPDNFSLCSSSTLRSQAYEAFLKNVKYKNQYTFEREIYDIDGVLASISSSGIKKFIPDAFDARLVHIKFESGRAVWLEYSFLFPESFSGLMDMKDYLTEKLGEPSEYFIKKWNQNDPSIWRRLDYGEAGFRIEFKTVDGILMYAKLFKTDPNLDGRSLVNPRMLITIQKDKL